MTARNLLLLACVLLLGAAIAPWLYDPVVRSAPAIAALAPPAAPDFNDPGPLETYDEIVNRPVFVASRRQAAAQPAPAASGEVLLLDRYPVVGVVIAGDQRLVLIRKAAGDTVSRIAQGEELDGWTLTEVSRDRLVMEMAGNRKEVSLQNNNGNAD